MRCINHNSPEVQTLAEQLNVHPAVAAAKVAIWQDKNGSEEMPTALVLKTFGYKIIGQDEEGRKSYNENFDDVSTANRKSGRVLWNQGLEKYYTDNFFPQDDNNKVIDSTISEQGNEIDSNVKDILGNSLEETLKSKYSTPIKNFVVAEYIAHRLLQKSDNFIGRLFEGLSERGVDPIKIFITNEERFSPFSIKLEEDRKLLEISIPSILKFGQGKTSLNSTLNSIETSLIEELIHLAQLEVNKDEDLIKIGQEVRKSNLEKFEQLYPLGEEKDDFTIGIEYTRMISQDILIGTVTQKPTRELFFLTKKLVNNLLNFLKKLFKNSSPLSQEVVKKTNDYINKLIYSEDKNVLLEEALSLKDQVNGLYRKVFETNVEQSLYEAASQANNSRLERQGAEKTFGKRIVEIAVQLFPDASFDTPFSSDINFNADYNNIGKKYQFAIRDMRTKEQAEESLDIVEEINKNKNVLAKIILQGENHYIELFDKNELPEDTIRIDINKDLTSQEQGDQMLDKVLFRMKQLMPEFSHQIVQQSEVKNIIPELTNQEILNTNAFVKGKTVYLVQGRFNPAMVIEEFLHPFVNHLYLDNKLLSQQLFVDGVSLFPELTDVYQQYKDRFDDETATKEVITRALSFLMDKELNTSDTRSILQRFLDWLSQVFNKKVTSSTTLEQLSKNISDREQQLDYIQSGTDFNIGKVDIQDVYARIKNIAPENGIYKTNIVEDGKTKEVYKDKKGNVVRRVTEVVKQKLKAFYKTNLDDASAEQKAEWEILAEKGTMIHKDIENVLRLYIDPSTGKKRSEPLDIEAFQPSATLTATYRDKYVTILDEYVTGLLETYSDDTRFLFETLVYDSKRKTPIAGTIDFIAIHEEGIDILDWKSVFNLKDGKIPAYKKPAWNAQISEYTNILKSELLLEDRDFRNLRIIPIQAVLQKNTNASIISKIVMGKPKPKEETDDTLLPFVTSKDAIYRLPFMSFVDKLNEVVKKEEEKQSAKLGYERRDYLLEAELENAVQVFALKSDPKGILNFIRLIEERAKATLEEVSKRLESPDNFTNEEIQYYSELINKVKDISEAFSDFYEFTENNFDEDTKASLKSDIDRYTTSILKFNNETKKFNKEFVKRVSSQKGILDIDNPETIIDKMKFWTRRLSSGATKSVQLFSSLLRPTFSTIEMQQSDAIHKSKRINNNLLNFAKSKGQTLEQVYEDFLEETKNGAPILKTKISQDFYKQKDLAAKSNNTALQFIKENYDVEAFKKEAEEFLKQDYANIDALNYAPEVARIKKQLAKKKLDLGNPALVINSFLLSRFLIEDKWYSPFYKNLLQAGNEPLKEFWDYMQDINLRAIKTGISKNVGKRFVPQVLKDTYETSAKKQWDRMITSLKISPDKYEFGNIDPITGRAVNKMFLAYTNDLGKDNDDYLALSRDLLKNFMLFENNLIEKENIQQLEEFSETLSDFEAAKETMDVNQFGGVLKVFKKDSGSTQSKRVQGRDGTNFKYYDKFKRMYIYGQKFQDVTDIPIPIGNGEHISGLQVMRSVANFSRLTAFGLNITSPIRNLVLGRINQWINGSPHFSSSLDISSALSMFDHTPLSILNVQDQKFMASLDYFLPFLNLQEKQNINKASLKAGSRIMTPENLMILMENSERVVQIAIFKALLNNSTVRDNKVVNINQWVLNNVKEKYGVSNIYDLPLDKRNSLQKDVDTEVKRIKSEDNIFNYMVFDSEKNMTIKGVERTDPSVAELRELSRLYSTQATGSTSEYDKSLYQTSFIGQMMGMYRSWIPATVQVRLGKVAYKSSGGIIEGRMRTLAKYLTNTGENKVKAFTRLISGFIGIHDKEQLIKVAKQLRNEKVAQLKESGQYSKEITQEEFVDLYLRNVGAAYKDLRATAALSLLVYTGLAAVLSGGGGDDEPRDNLSKIVERELKKYNNELTFYYNPMEAFAIVQNPFPVTSYYANLFRFGTNLVSEPFNPDSNSPLKYAFRAFPITNTFAGFLPILDEDLAKEFGIKITTNYGIR